jgi:NAD(P)-dependent dehydrogenase (short-subunit alcohol dehydrogenase family)
MAFLEGEFSGRVAVVTGSSKGIGRATAERLARAGAAVVINSRDEAELDEVARPLRAEGAEVLVAAGNVARAGGAKALIDAAVGKYGRVDLVVNTVGLSASFGPLLEVDFDAFSLTMIRNTWPTVELAQAAVAAGMGKGGAIVAVSTIGARTVHPEVAPYCASKAALELLVRNLAYELGPRGIRVNAVAPGLIVTEMSRVLWDDGQTEAESDLLPLGRLGQPDDIAAAICFLLSDASSWMTGQVVDVEGGRTLVGQGPARLLRGPRHHVDPPGLHRMAN